MSRRLQSCLFVVLLASAAGSRASAREVPFAAPATLAGLEAWGARAVADVDGDGDLDLFAASDGSGGDSVRWYERTNGSSPPAFVEHTIFAFGGNELATYLVAVDLDRDGDLDAAMLADDYDDDTVALIWAENDGTPAVGSWTRRSVTTWDPPLGGIVQSDTFGALAAADLDGDGDPDLLAAYGEWEILEADPDGRVVWLRSDGTPANGGWSSEPLVDWTTDRVYEHLVPADLDGDDDLDVVLSVMDTDGSQADSVQWAENDGTPGVGFWLRRQIAGLAGSWVMPAPAIGDFDRDRDVDVAVDDSPDAALRWFQNDGTPADGGWVAHTVDAAPGFGGTVASDLDRDGDQDLVGGSWYENDGTPANGTWAEHLDTSLSTELGDLDLDGDPDALRFGFEWTENLELHRSARLLDESAVSTAVDEAYDVATGDVDGDGDLDLVSAAEAIDRVQWHENRLETEQSWLPNTVTISADGVRAVAAGDLDGDGDVDLVSASYNDDTVAWYENDGTPGWTRRVISSGAGGAIDVALADFDRDGDLDVACAQFLDDEVSWYRNSGAQPPTFGAFFVDSVPYDGPRALAAGDFEGNGTPDLAVVAENGDSLVFYSNDGTPADGEWTRHRVDNADLDAPRDVAAADLDRDGDLDLVVADALGDRVVWYENDGTFAGWTERAANVACGGARGVASGDFDADGDPDLLVSCFDDDALWLARSNGASPPSFTNDLVTIAANGVRTAVAADLDRDGDLDAAAAQGFDDTVAWYENRGGQFRVVGTAIAADPLVNDQVRALFRAVVAHRGRSGDSQMELSSVAVRLEETPGDPLDAFQAASLIDFVLVYGDDGDSTFEPGVDPLLASVSPAGIDGAGTVWLDLADGAAGAGISALASKTYFVALDFADPFAFAAPRTLVATLLTDGASVCKAEDRAHDLPLELEWRANVATATVVVLDLLFRDGFESGNTTAWSDTQP